jgi:YVTN family beta-propeller protein
VQISEFNGFVVVDFAERRELRRVALPEVPVAEQGEPPFNGAPAHGIGVAPNGETLWVASRINGYVYAYSLPEVELLGGVRVGSHPDWLTFTPDSRHVYVANGHSDDVSIIDIASRREIKRLKVGSAPKRNITTVLP